MTGYFAVDETLGSSADPVVAPSRSEPEPLVIRRAELMEAVFWRGYWGNCDLNSIAILARVLFMSFSERDAARLPRAANLTNVPHLPYEVGSPERGSPTYGSS
jgi:hypothetical protein